MTNKTELFIQIDNTSNDSLRFSDTYLAPSIFGTVLGLEFQGDVSDTLSVGDTITIDKDNKTINPWVDGTTTILGITSSSVFPPPGSLVLTNTPLQLPITFTNNEGGALYEGISISSDWIKVDLSDNVPFPITFNIADVREINNRNGAYSKTISIPGSKTNDQVFKYIFDIQSINNYDTRKKVKCNVIIETIPILEGYIQLNNITCDDNKHWTYECNIFGENANFSKVIDQNAKLEDLDFSEYTHDFNIDAVTQSWIGDWNNGYYYPLIDYNTGVDPNNAPNNAWDINNMKTSIYAKQYWNKIFEAYGYTYESEFLDTDSFNNLIIPCNKKYIENDPDWRFNSTFRAGLTQSISFTTDFGYIQSNTGTSSPPLFNPQMTSVLPSTNMENLLQLNDVISPNGDPGGNFTQIPGGNFYYENIYQANHDKDQTLTLNIDYKITGLKTDGSSITSSSATSSTDGIRMILFYQVFVNSQLKDTASIINMGNPVGEEVLLFDYLYNSILNQLFGEPELWDMSIFNRRTDQISIHLPGLLPNDKVYIKLGLYFTRAIQYDSTTTTPYIQQLNYLQTKFKIDFYPTTNNVPGTFFFNTIDPVLINTQPFVLNNAIPGNIKQIDFINSIIKMFNLYLLQDPSNPTNIFIEPRDRFYGNDILTWSDKLDIDKDIIHQPIVDRKKRVLLSYKDDKDFWNADYKGKTNEIYGQYEYLTGNEIDTSDQKIEVIFSPSPLVMRKINDSLYDNRWLYTQILDPKQPITTDNYNKVDSNIRILYRKNIELADGLVFRLKAGGFSRLFNTYPYAGHLDDPMEPTMDLGFGAPRQLYYKSDQFYTGNNIYTTYYEQFFEEIYGVESKHITAYFYLTPQDIIDFDYRKLIFIESMSSGSSGYFRVNKIEYDPFNKQSYKVELIKVLNDFKSRYRKKATLDDSSTLPSGPGNGVVLAGNDNTGDSNIIGGIGGFVSGSNNIVGGADNSIKQQTTNTLVTGASHSTSGKNSGIVGGRLSNISGSGVDSVILGGASHSLNGRYSAIIGGNNNNIDYNSFSNVIINGEGNVIASNPTGTFSSPVTNSFIIGGYNNTIEVGTTQSKTDNVFILGGNNNTIASGVTNSFIIGGDNFTATQSNSIYLNGDVYINGSTFSIDPIWDSNQVANRLFIDPLPVSGVDTYNIGHGVTISSINMSQALNLGEIRGTSTLRGGVAVFAGATVTVNNTLVKSTSVIMLTPMSPCVVGDIWYVTNIVPNVSFDIVSVNTLGVGTVIAWLLIND